MAYTPDLSGEYVHWSGTETVTLTFRDHQDAKIGGASLATRTVKRHSKESRPEVFSDVQATPDSSFWSIPSHSDVVGTNVPAKGTIIKDSGNVEWIVQRVQERRVAGSLVSWHCWAVKKRRAA